MQDLLVASCVPLHIANTSILGGHGCGWLVGVRASPMMVLSAVGSSRPLVDIAAASTDGDGGLDSDVAHVLPAGLDVCGMYAVLDAADPSVEDPKGFCTSFLNQCRDGKSNKQALCGMLASRSSHATSAVSSTTATCPSTTTTAATGPSEAESSQAHCGCLIGVFCASRDVARIFSFVPHDDELRDVTFSVEVNLRAEFERLYACFYCSLAVDFSAAQSAETLFGSPLGAVFLPGPNRLLARGFPSENGVCRSLFKDDRSSACGEPMLAEFLVHAAAAPPSTDVASCAAPTIVPLSGGEDVDGDAWQRSCDLQVVCYVRKDQPLAVVRQRICASLKSQYDACVRLAAAQSCHPKAYTFRPVPTAVISSSQMIHVWPHFLTLLYPLPAGPGPCPDPDSRPELVALRRGYHVRLGLPLERPQLRTTSAVKLHSKDHVSSAAGAPSQSRPPRGRSVHLVNVHVELPPPGAAGGSRTALVDGEYEYYHYMQDQFDDKGWGCAYRSLQTLFSWFRLQHFTSQPVPSIPEIQQILVTVEQRRPEFIGTRQWIGSLEVSSVLMHMIPDLECKIMTLSSGTELANKGRDLLAHFHTHGTPVMMGGGALAYTLLGVDYNEATGQISFLILDPHYTGEDTLRPIQHGGWVGWKKVDHFSKSFYNLCMPLRPRLF